MNKISPRTWTILFAGFAVIALVLLSASLNSLEMAAGKQFAFNEIEPQLMDNTISFSWGRIFLAIFRALMIIGWVVLPIYIIMLFVSKEERKNFLRRMASMLPFFIMLYFLMNSPVIKKVTEQFNPRMFGTPSEGQAVGTQVPPPAFVPPAHWVTTFAVIAIALVITLILTGIFLVLWGRSRARLYMREPLRKVEREAQAALDAIRSGGDLREAILRCYVQMVETVREYRGIFREQDMTPHEFEVFLKKQGMPGEPVHELTRLFEEVRYSTFKPGRKDEQAAIMSLSAIVSACQRIGRKQGANDGQA